MGTKFVNAIMSPLPLVEKVATGAARVAHDFARHASAPNVPSWSNPAANEMSGSKTDKSLSKKQIRGGTDHTKSLSPTKKLCRIATTAKRQQWLGAVQMFLHL
jgi:hypothetical protein